MNTGLYGIENSNRGLDDHWSKNSFSSSFPASIAAYMLDRGIDAVYMYLDRNSNGELELKHRSVSVSEAFGCGNLRSKDLWFLFETPYEPYKRYCSDRLDGIDLVIGTSEKDQLRPLEIKLTAYPDNKTADLPESQQGAELVIRSATTEYCALGMFDSTRKSREDVRKLFDSSCFKVDDWNSEPQVSEIFPGLYRGFSKFLERYFKAQKPILMQVLWKTEGRSPILAEDAFQVIFWSDFAISWAMLKKCMSSRSSMSRPMRALAKVARTLWELSKSESINLKRIYREMAYGEQTDKEFSISGREWRNRLVKDLDLSRFPLSRDVVREIVFDGYIHRLKPERRLDQTLYFTFS